MPNEVIYEKLWGEERVLHNSGGYCMKELTLNFGWQSSLHMHPVKAETFLVISGIVLLELETGTERMRIELRPGNHVSIAPGQYHRFKATTGRAVVIEASTEHSDDDVVRSEPSRRCGLEGADVEFKAFIEY